VSRSEAFHEGLFDHEETGFSVEDNTLHLHGKPFHMARPAYDPEKVSNEYAPPEGGKATWHGWTVPMESGNQFHISGMFVGGKSIPANSQRYQSGDYSLHSAVHKGDDPEWTGNLEPWSPVHSPEHLKEKLIEASKYPGSGKGRRVGP
jgi:hypothetical protein